MFYHQRYCSDTEKEHKRNFGGNELLRYLYCMNFGLIVFLFLEDFLPPESLFGQRFPLSTLDGLMGFLYLVIAIFQCCYSNLLQLVFFL